jgi:hypothetical protein
MLLSFPAKNISLFTGWRKIEAALFHEEALYFYQTLRQHLLADGIR